jgi:hypothetical protein
MEKPPCHPTHPLMGIYLYLSSAYLWPSDIVKSPHFFKHGSCFSFFWSFYLFYFFILVFSVIIIILYTKNKGTKFPNITNYESFFLKEEKGVLPYYWLPNRTYHKSLEFYKLFFSTKSGQFGTIYFPWKILQIGWNLKSYILGAKLAKNLVVKKIKELHVGSSMYITTHTE